MDRFRYTALGHQGLPLWHPHDPGALERLIGAAKLDAGSRVLDAGCGCGEVALRIVERTGARVLAIDASPIAIELARKAARHRDPSGRLKLECAWFDPSAPVAERHDLCVCVGSTAVGGGFAGTVSALGARTVQDGRLLLGDLFWARPPEPGFVEAFFGGDRAALPDRAQVLEQAEQAGWSLVEGHDVSPEGWDCYERQHHANLVSWAEEHAGDPEACELRARSEAWFAGWQRWGRHCLGFGLWLFSRLP